MRYTPISCAMALAFICVSSVGISQQPDTQIDPRSTALVQEAKNLMVAGKYDAANDTLESALIIDPRNRGAYIALANVAQKQDLNGKAIRMYREALKLEPNDVSALSGQGEAMVAKGAMARAKENLDRITKLCVSRCAEQIALSSAITKGPPATTLTAVKPSDVAKKSN